jgi:hypothetical protein
MERGSDSVALLNLLVVMLVFGVLLVWSELWRKPVVRAVAKGLDSDVEKALNMALLDYQAERQQWTPRSPTLGALPEMVYVSLKQVCNWRLGRLAGLAPGDARPLALLSPLSLDEVIACLKRIRKSVQKWNRQAGQRGYLQFVAEYIG